MKTQKRSVIITVTALVLIFCCIAGCSDVLHEDYNNVVAEQNSLQSQVKEQNDINYSSPIPTTLTRDQYPIITKDVELKDGTDVKYEVFNIGNVLTNVTNFTFDGENIELEMCYISALVFANIYNDITDYKIDFVSRDEPGLYISEGGELTASYLPASYLNIGEINMAAYANEMQELCDALDIDVNVAMALGSTQSNTSTGESSEDYEIVYDDDYVTIKFVKCSKNEDSYCILYNIIFFITNKTDVELTLQPTSFSINGISYSDIDGSENVAPKSSGFVYFYTTKSSVPTSGINSVSGGFNLFDFSEKLTGKASLYKINY